MASNISDPKHFDQDPFPFMKLPPELRTLVYTFALQNFIDEVEAGPAAKHASQLPKHGALALLEVDSLRYESSDAMRLPMRAHYERYERLRDECFANIVQGRLDFSPNKVRERDTISGRANMLWLMNSKITHVHVMEVTRIETEKVCRKYRQDKQASSGDILREIRTSLSNRGCLYTSQPS